MILFLLYLLSHIRSQVINLDDNIICQGIPCNMGNYSTNTYNYGSDTFGDLTGISFQLSFYIKLYTNITQSFLFSVMQGSVIQMSIAAQRSVSQVQFIINNTLQSGQFNIKDWFQVIVNNTDVNICNYESCVKTEISLNIQSTSRFNFFIRDSSNYWLGLGYGITLYKGFSSLQLHQVQNMLQPEAILDINVQEKQQHNITIDYSQYEYVAKLGNEFYWDDKDPYLELNGLLFNGSNYIYVKDPKLRETYSIEFRLSVSDIFSSNIVLLNYTYFNKYQVLVSLNGKLQINVLINGQTTQFTLIAYQVIHICIGVIHHLEENLKYHQLSLLQFSNTGILQEIKPTIFVYQISSSVFKSGIGELYIGSKQNIFTSSQYMLLYHLRVFLGFFFDDQGIIDPLCQVYLNDRCNICVVGYVLAIDHSCQLACTQTTLLTQFIESHNQCLRLCSPICASCLPSSPLICLLCNGVRSQPPNCICPAGYFEDGISPDCRKYFQEVQTQIGFIDAWCTNRLDIYTQITFDRPYLQTPSLALFYTGYRSVSQGQQHIHNTIHNESPTGFQILVRCFQADYYQVYWISSIGTYRFTSEENHSEVQNVFTIAQPQYKNNVLFTTFPVMRDINGYNTETFSLSINKFSDTIYNVQTSGGDLRFNLMSSPFVNYFFFSPTNHVYMSFNNIPKSIQQFTIITGFVSNYKISFLIKQKQRSRTLYYIYNTHQIENFMGNMQFLTQSCYDQQACDFYSSYITSCSLKYSFCSCEESGYYLNSANECDQCSLNCGTCIGIKTYCTSCNPVQFRTLVNNNCVCSGKYFPQAGSLICGSCDFRCLTCQGPLRTDCLSCHPTQLPISSNECSCQNGYYFNKDQFICIECLSSQFVDLEYSICVDCDPQCKSCNLAGCLTCQDTRQLTNTVECTCKDGYFEDNQQTCSLCHKSCLTCTSMNICTSCLETIQILIDDQCYCPDRYYKNSQTYLCESCQQSCLKCLDVYICIQCSIDKILVNHHCKCQDNQYIDVNSICQDCSSLCVTCFGQNNQCSSCSENKYLTQNNECLCKSGYFNNNNICQKCDQSCTECINNNECLTCSYNRQLDISNLCVCQQGYYETQDAQCQACDIQCNTCNQDSCLSCSSNKILLNDRCVCEGGFYLNGNTCLSCDDGYGKFNNQCEVDCQDGIWSPGEQCDDGNNISGDGCSNCIIDQQYQCIPKGQISFCYKCEQNCQQCNYVSNELQCQLCEDGYFLNQNLCLKCSQDCLTCFNTSTNCVKCRIKDQIPDQNFHCQGCESGYYFDNECISKCGDGIKTQQEDCDDGNIVQGDGCNQYCQVEPDYQCLMIDQQSLCQQIIKLELFLNKIQQISNKSYFIQIESTQIVYFNNIELYISDNTETFTYLPSYQKFDLQLKILQINCTINFTNQIPSQQFQFIIRGEIYDSFNQPLQANIINHKFGNLQSTSDNQKELTSLLSQSATYQILGTFIIFSLKVLLYGSGQFSTMLRVNNILQYIKFIDIELPPNLIEFLLELEGFNVINQMDLIQIINSIKFLPQIEFEYIQPHEQFRKYSINAYFVSNILPFVLNVIVGQILTYYLYFQIQILKNIIRRQNVEQMKSIRYRILVWLQIYSQKFYLEFRNQGFQQLFEASQYNIFFAISLQLQVSQLSTKKDLINFTLVIGFLLFSVFKNYLRMKNKNGFIKQGRRIFSLVRILDPSIYIVCIVFLKKFPLCQLIIIQLSQLIMIRLLIKLPFRDILLNYQTIIEEIILLVLFKSFLIYIYFPLEVDYILLGFLQMGLITLILTSNTCIQTYDFINQFKQLYSKQQMKLQKQRNRSIQNDVQLMDLEI